MQQPDWLERAWRELGVREQPGAVDNPRIRSMFKDAGHSQVVRDEVAWCAAFVGACLERSGRKSTRSLMARSYLKWGEPIAEPRFGAIAVLSRGRNTSLGHVGFVVGVVDDEIQILGGNQGQQVSVQSYPKSRLVGLRWPSLPADVPSTPSAPDIEEDEHRRAVARADDVGVVEAGAGQHYGGVFDIALTHVLEMEGGYSDDPHDPGGPTNKGITIAVYAKWIGETLDGSNRARLAQRLKRIPEAMVREIYATRYWTPAGCGDMPVALALMHFDAAVNHGVGSAIRMLQEATGATIDGEIGPETRRAIAREPVGATLRRYADIRRDRYRALPHFWRFGKGWLRRVDRTLDLAEQRNSEAERAHNKKQSSSRKGDDDMTVEQSTVQRPEAKWWGESMTIWGVLVTALSTVLPVIGPLVGLDVSGEMVRMLGDHVVQIAQAVGGLLGTLMAIYGRVRAQAPIERRAVSLRL